MAIAIKAGFNFSATAATTTTWSLTASTSVAVGDVVVLAVSFRESATINDGYITGITDNAGNTWANIGQVQNSAAVTAVRTEMWYAPVGATTANYQIALTFPGKTISSRAAIVTVLSGLDPTAPLDTATVKIANYAATTSTVTASTSNATTTPDSIAIVAIGHGTGAASLSANAAWTRLGGVAGAGNHVSSGATGLTLDKYGQIAAASQVYSFSASLSPTGINVGIIAAAFKTTSGVITGTATMSMTSTASLIAYGALSGNITASMTSTASLIAYGALTGNITASMTSTASLIAYGALSTGDTIAMSSTADLVGVQGGASATESAAIAQITARGGGGHRSWDPIAFAQLLRERKRQLQEKVAEVANEAENTPVEPRAERLEQRVQQFEIPDSRGALIRAAQSLDALARQLARLQTQIEEAEEDNDDDLLIMVA